MHPDVPYPEQRLARPVLHVRQHVRPGDGRQPAARDAGGPGPRGRRGPPDDRDREVGRHRAAGDDLVREDRPHGDAAPPVPPAPAGGDRARRRVALRAVDVARDRAPDRSREGRRVLRDGRGGGDRGDPGHGRRPGRPDGGHHPGACSRPGPVRLPVADPDIPFLDQVENLVPFPPRSLPAPLEATAAFIPTRRIEFYKEEERFRDLGEPVPTYRPPFDDEVHDPGDVAAVAADARTASGGSTRPTPTTRGWKSSTAVGPRCSSRPRTRTRATSRPATRSASGTPRGEVVAWAHVTPSEQPGSVTLYEGWWPRQFAQRQGRQRADLVGGQPDPRGPLRRQHVGPVDRLEGLPVRHREGG